MMAWIPLLHTCLLLLLLTIMFCLTLHELHRTTTAIREQALAAARKEAVP